MYKENVHIGAFLSMGPHSLFYADDSECYIPLQPY